MKPLAWLRRVGGTSLAIMLHPTCLGRFALLRTYWRVSLKHLVLVQLLRRRITSERVFSQTIHFADYATFLILFEEIYVSGVYFFEATNPAPLILDAGANIGVSIAYFKTIHPQCRIRAFEAEPRNFELLTLNSRSNGWRDVELHQIALHRAAGELPFYDYHNAAGALSSGFWRPESAGAPKRVLAMRTVPLSRYLDGPVELLKLDVEGSEYAILQDLAESGKLVLIRQLILEYHHHVQPGEDLLGAFLLLLESAGFGYQLRAPLALPFPRGCPQNFMMSAYSKSFFMPLPSHQRVS